MASNDLTLLKEIKKHAEKFAELMWEAQQKGYNIKCSWDGGKLQVFEVFQMVPVHLEQQ